MSIGHSALLEELKRLKSAGGEHVFINDETYAQLLSAQSSAPAKAERPERPPAASNLKALVGIDETSTRKPPPPVKAKASNLPDDYVAIPDSPPKLEIPDGSSEERLRWLEETVLNCQVCQQHLSEDGKIAFGAGLADADILFCGEAPGADEEIDGTPFAGKAGDLLNKILQAMGIKRESVYLTNILKWRPEHDKPYGNRPPTMEEMKFCLPYLQAQIEIIQPKVIVALGNTTVTGLFGPDPKRRMADIRGTWLSFNSTPTIITFHPSYLLRNDTMKTKRMAWEDMLQVMQKVDLPINDKQRGYFLPK